MSPNVVDPLWKAWATTWSSHNMDHVLSLYTSDCIYELVPSGTVYHGKEELRGFGQDFFAEFPDAKCEMTSGFVAGNWAGGEWIMTGTYTGSLLDRPTAGKRVSVRGSSILELVDRTIRRCGDYWDTATTRRQLGLLPPSEQAGA